MGLDPRARTIRSRMEADPPTEPPIEPPIQPPFRPRVARACRTALRAPHHTAQRAHQSEYGRMQRASPTKPPIKRRIGRMRAKASSSPLGRAAGEGCFGPFSSKLWPALSLLKTKLWPALNRPLAARLAIGLRARPARALGLCGGPASGPAREACNSGAGLNTRFNGRCNTR